MHSTEQPIVTALHYCCTHLLFTRTTAEPSTTWLCETQSTLTYRRLLLLLLRLLLLQLLLRLLLLLLRRRQRC
mgnify:CR=1 FL=1